MRVKTLSEFLSGRCHLERTHFMTC